MYKGIYILKTVDEFRIFAGDIDAACSAIDGLTGRYILRPKVIKELFGGSEVFSTEECAFKAAMEIGKIIGEVEDGIYIVKDIETVYFDSFVEEK